MGGRKKKVQVIKSRGEVTAQGMTIKEWQRTPKQLLNEFCQNQKRPKPIFKKAPCRDPDQFRTRVVLRDPKGKSEKDIVLCTVEGYPDVTASQHASALLALKQVDGARQHEKRLPEPFRTAWLAMGGGGDTNDDTKGGVESKRAKKAREAAEKDAAATSFDCRFCDKTFKKEHAVAIHLKQMHAAEIAAEQKAQEEEEEALAAQLAGGGDTGASGASSVKTSRGASATGGGGGGGGGGGWDLYGDAPAETPAPLPKAPAIKPEDFKITAQGRFATQYDRRMAQESRKETFRVKQRKREAHKMSNPYATVFMSEEHRVFVEKVVKSFAKQLQQRNATSSSSGSSDNGGKQGVLSRPEAKALIKLGFRNDDVADALAQCGEGLAQDVYLDWLCLYAPEEYLPDGFDPRGKQLEVVSLRKAGDGMANSSTEAALALLSDATGTPVDLASKDAETVLDGLFDVYASFCTTHAETDAAWPLGPNSTPQHEAAGGDVAEAEAEAQQLREDELMALESMFEGGEVTSEHGLSVSSHEVSRHVIKIGAVERVPGESLIEVIAITRSATAAVYPFQPALVAFFNPALNRHVNAHMTLELTKLAHTLMAAPQLYELYDLVRSELADLVAARKTFPFKSTSSLKRAVDAGLQVTAASDLLDAHAAGKDGKNAGGKSSDGKGRGNRSGRGHAKIDNGEEMRASQLRRKKTDAKYQAMLAARAKLPAHQHAIEVITELDQNQVVLISGETGCGKTTQVPQFILDEAIESGAGGKVNILCTQPRRLAAIGVATRVNDERCEERIGGTVGYQIRLENKTSAKTRLTFVTTGILLRRLQGDPMLEGVTHILVDEVHERSVDTDFLLSILKALLPRRPDLKLLLMSATMDAVEFCDYFNTRSVVQIPGFVHPVKDIYLAQIVDMLRFPLRISQRDKDQNPVHAQAAALAQLERRTDYDLLANLVYEIDKQNASTDGSILIFMSGAGEIQRAIRSIVRASSGNLMVLPLHGGLSGKDQGKVFARAPKGQRKVVVSTNVAETSITINDVVFVIDSGKMKETRYDATNRMSQLVEDWVSRNSARQRRGRAGRVQPGQCFKLYTKKRHDVFFHQAQLPEIHRVPLEQLVMQVLASELGQPETFMNTLMEPPPSISVKEAVRLLLDVGAADQDHPGAKVTLTALGRHLSRLPMDVRIGKMLLFGCLLQCADQVLTIAGGLNVRNPFMCPPEKRNEANEAKKALLGGESVEVTQSDHICLMYAYERWSACASEREKRSFADKYFLSHQSLCEIRDLRRDLSRTLGEIGFDTSSTAKHVQKGSTRILTRESVSLVKAALCAGLYPNVINVRKPVQKFAETQGGAVAQAPHAQQLRFMVRRAQGVEEVEAAYRAAQAAADRAAKEAAAAAEKEEQEARAAAKAKKAKNGGKNDNENDDENDDEWAAVLDKDVDDLETEGNGDGGGDGEEEVDVGDDNSYDGRSIGSHRSGSTYKGNSRFDLERVFLHPSSVLFHQREYHNPWLVYREKVKTTKVFIRDATVVPPYSLLMFGGKIEVQHERGIITVDGWITFRAQARIGVLVRELRRILDMLLDEKIAHPNLDIANTDVLLSIKKLIIGSGFMVGSS
ncbi:ATP-dependent RNA helicase [Hondaea fermentalgiana]|uniref:RNA helicase n=1 Tax=Hondaea fermentalgiana TaxID=2315210 RepID=A0A2R5GVP9_9STRA|nr:ATP-dependent RNA helicase [Hondaea fermentalgiana]|eukprot:GBG34645.1 ATP-dependent RNA helicase [Hondaea fermentalgiana]